MIINQIAKGGSSGNPVAEENDVIFIDYDGTICYSYTADEFLALTELPPNPHHDGLTAQGWHYTLAQAKEHVALYGALDILQLYCTDDGKTRLFFSEIDTEQEYSLRLQFATNSGATVNIDWGDGSTTTGVGTGSPVVYEHTYTSGDARTIAFSTSGESISLSSYQSFFVDGLPRFYLTRIVFANNVAGISGNCFQRCIGLKDIIISRRLANTTTGTQGYVIQSCPSLSSAWVANGYYVASNVNTKFKAVVFSPTQTIIYMLCSGVSHCGRVFLPDSTITIQDYALDGEGAVKYFYIPRNVANIGSRAFNGHLSCCFRLKIYPSSPPVVSNSNAWMLLGNLIGTGNVGIYVPYASLAAYLTATNYPNPATYAYFGFATYESGVTLPTQDSTQAYNVVWYASKDDAAAQTNPITVGNGKEIYCRYTAV